MAGLLRIGIGPIPLAEGGVRTHISHIMANSAHEFVPIRYSPLSLFWPGYRGVGYTAFASRPFVVPDPYALLLAQLRLRNLDLVHTHGHPYWLPLYNELRHLALGRLHTVHQIYYDDEARTLREKIMRANQNARLIDECQAATTVISVSESLQRSLRELYGIASIVIPNGVDVEECRRGNADRFSRLTGIPHGFILYVGSLLGVKQPELVCRIAERLPSLQLVAIGSGLLPDAMAAEFGNVPANVRGLGLRPHATLLDAIHACAAVLVTSRRESSSYVMLEALACGKPVVGPRRPGIDEVLARVSRDLLYDPENLDSAEASVKFAIDHPSIGEIGRERVEESFNWKRIAPRLDAVYLKTMEDFTR